MNEENAAAADDDDDDDGVDTLVFYCQYVALAYTFVLANIIHSIHTNNTYIYIYAYAYSVYV